MEGDGTAYLWPLLHSRRSLWRIPLRRGGHTHHRSLRRGKMNEKEGREGGEEWLELLRLRVIFNGVLVVQMIGDGREKRMATILDQQGNWREG